MFDPFFERLAGWATGPRFEAEVASARAAFFDATGRIYEDDRSFEARMTALSEYYLLDRPLEGDPARRTPAQLFLDEQGAGLLPEERAVFEDFAHTGASLFEIRKVRASQVVLRDHLLDGERTVDERRQLPGVEKGDLVQVRVFPFRGLVVLGPVFVFHPREARRLILKAVKRHRKTGGLDTEDDRRALLWKLARQALAFERQQANNRTPLQVDRLYGEL